MTETWYLSGLKTNLHVDDEGRTTRVERSPTHAAFARGPGSPTPDIQYHPAGGVESYVLGNGVASTLQYSSQTGCLGHLSSGPLDLTYAYDDLGNVLGIADSRAGNYSQSYT